MIFDLGGVICGSPFHALFAYADEVGLPPEVLGESVRTDGKIELLAKCETGEITMADYFDEVAAAIGAEHGIAIEGARMLECVAACMDPLPASVDLVQEVRRTHRTALLTNASSDIRHRWRPLVADLFDAIVDSSEVRLRKPEPEIYRQALALLDVAPERAVFVDDQEVNVEGARALGMQGVVCSSGDQMRLDLAACGVRIRPVA